MRLPLSVIVLVGFIWAALANNAAAITPPSGPPPTVADAILKDGKLFLQESTAVLVSEARTRTVKRPDGTEATESYTVTKPVFNFSLRPVSAGDFRIFTVAGEPLAADAVTARLAEETTVLVSSCGKKLDPAYMPLFEPQTLIVYLRPQVLCSPGGPMMVPPPPAASMPTVWPEFKKPAPAAIRPMPVWATLVDGKLQVTLCNFKAVNETKFVTKTVASHRAPNQTYEVCEPKMTTHWLPTLQQQASELAASQLVALTGEPLDASSLAQTGGQMEHLVLAVDKDLPLEQVDLRLFAPTVRLLRHVMPPVEHAPMFGPSVAPLVQGRAKVAGDTLTVSHPIFEIKFMTVKATMVRDGKEEVIEKQVCETVSKPMYQQFALSVVHASTADGKQLDDAALTKRLASEQPVILVAQDKKVSADDLKLLKADTILLSAPGFGLPPAPVEGPRPVPHNAPVPSLPGAPSA